MIALIRSNCAILQQGIDLLKKHSSESYCHADPARFGSSVGSHLRHVLDHYNSVLAGASEGKVDYDNRKRRTEVETSLEQGLATLRRVKEELESLSLGPDLPLKVAVSSAVDDKERECSSSLGRELQFLVSHTVHHYALIAIASRMQGIEPEPSFGVAPSTLKYLQAVSS